MLRIPLSTLLVGTVLFVVPAAAQTDSAAGQFIAQQSPDQWRAYKTDKQKQRLPRIKNLGFQGGRL